MLINFNVTLTLIGGLDSDSRVSLTLISAKELKAEYCDAFSPDCSAQQMREFNRLVRMTSLVDNSGQAICLTYQNPLV